MNSQNFQPRLGDDIKVEYQGELMDNYFAESTINSSAGLKAIRFQDNRSILLYVDKEHELKLLIQHDETDAGWTSYQISPENSKVTTFDVHHNLSGDQLRISYAGVTKGNNHLMVSDLIDLATVEPLLFTANLRWTAKRVVDVGRKIDHISMSKEGLLYSTSHSTQDANYAYFRYGQEPIAYTLPENTDHAIQLKTGQIYQEFGIFILYDMQVENTLLFQSFPDAEDGEISNHRFKPTAKINTFSTLDTGRKGDSILYLAGDGVFQYDNPDAEVQVISPAGNGPEFTKMEVACNDQETTIWAIGSEGERTSSGLYYLTNRFYAGSNEVQRKWTQPLMMQHAIDDFAAIKSNQLINQLFLFGSEENESQLIHFWQDKVTTNWHEHPVTVPNGQVTLTRKTFTIHVHFNATNALRAFNGQKIKLTAEANMNVYLDHKRHLIGPQHEVELTIDKDTVTIIYPTQSIAASKLILTADFLAESISIDPTISMRDKITYHFTDKDRLKAAKLPNGKPLVSGASEDELSQVASASKQMVEHIDTVNNPKAAPAVMAMMAPRAMANTSILSGLGNALGDIWHSTKKGFSKAVSVVASVVSEGVKFVVNIGGEIFNWISKAVSDVFHFLEHIWEKIKVFFKDLYEFLAFLFNWEDIINTKKVLKEHTSNMIEGLADNLNEIRKKTYSFFEEVKTDIQDKKEAVAFDGLKGKKLNDVRNENTKNQKTDPRANVLNAKKDNITKSNGTQQVLTGIPVEIAQPALGVVGELVAHATAMKDDFVHIFGDVSDKLGDVINGDMDIGSFLEYFVLSLAELGVGIAQEIIDLVFKLLELAVRGVNDAFNASINIPFFSALYKKVSGDDLSVSDLIHLLLAVPVTVLHKLAEKRPPFSRSGEGEQYIASGKQIFVLNF